MVCYCVGCGIEYADKPKCCNHCASFEFVDIAACYYLMKMGWPFNRAENREAVERAKLSSSPELPIRGIEYVKEYVK